MKRRAIKLIELLVVVAAIVTLLAMSVRHLKPSLEIGRVRPVCYLEHVQPAIHPAGMLHLFVSQVSNGHR